MIRPSATRRAAGRRLLAAATGVLAIHQVAYLVAHPSVVGRTVATQGHGYLAPVASVVVPAAAALALWVVVCRLGGMSRSHGQAAVARTGDYLMLFAVQEVAERLVQGHSPVAVLGEPALWFGLALAPLLAFVGAALGRSLDRVEAPSPGLVVAVPRPVLGIVAPALAVRPVFSLTPAVRRVRGPPISLR